MRYKTKIYTAMAAFGVLAIGCATGSGAFHSDPDRVPAGAYGSKPFREQDFLQILKSEPTKTIPGVLTAINQSFPEKLINPVLMYRSHSIQQSSFLSPRVIAFGGRSGDGKNSLRDSRPSDYERLIAGDTIIAFNGEAKQEGFNSIELMHFDDATKEFKFREVVFKKEATPTASQKEDVEFETSDFIVSQPNPGRCLDCHGYVSAHPLFESYPKWPGAYFSNEERHDFSRDPGNYSRGKLLDIQNKNKEANQWASFKTKLASDNRYSTLKFENGYLTPNTFLNILLDSANARRIAHIIASHPQLGEFSDILGIALYQFPNDNLEQTLVGIPALNSQLKKIFAKYYAAEIRASQEEVDNLGAENVSPGTVTLERDEQQFVSHYSTSLRSSGMSLVEKMAFKQATAFSGAAGMAILTALDEKYHDQLLTYDWSLSPFGSQPFRSVYATDQDDILKYLNEELKSKGSKIKFKEYYEDVETQLSEFFK